MNRMIYTLLFLGYFPKIYFEKNLSLCKLFLSPIQKIIVNMKNYRNISKKNIKI